MDWPQLAVHLEVCRLLAPAAVLVEALRGEDRQYAVATQQFLKIHSVEGVISEIVV